MGWCYTFGIRCGSDCNGPMLVLEGTRSCACTTCGARCAGKFSNCQEIVFRPGGLDFQIRCLPDRVLAAMNTATTAPRRAAVGLHPRPDESSPAGPGSPEPAPVGPPPHMRLPTPPEGSLSELRSGFAKLIESTAALNLSVAKLESEVASLRRDLTLLTESLSARIEPIARRPRAG